MRGEKMRIRKKILQRKHHVREKKKLVYVLAAVTGQ